MKFIKYSIYSLFLTFTVFSCADEPLPFETFENMEKGAFSKLLSTDGGSFFYTDVDNSSFTFDLEYYSENNGGEVAANEWFVRHRNNAAGTISEAVMVGSVTSSAFGTNAKSGLPTASFAFNMADAMTAMGITYDDLNGGDDFIFDGFVVMKDGRRFGPDNTGNSIQGGAGFDGRFRFVKPLLCTSDLSGQFDLVATGWCGDTHEGVYEFRAVDGAPGQYTIWDVDNEMEDFSLGSYYPCYGVDATLPGGDLTLIDACNLLSTSGTSRWGETYFIDDIIVVGPTMTIVWHNDYAPEAGTSVMTRKDGTDWPPFTF